MFIEFCGVYFPNYKPLCGHTGIACCYSGFIFFKTMG